MQLTNCTAVSAQFHGSQHKKHTLHTCTCSMSEHECVWKCTVSYLCTYGSRTQPPGSRWAKWIGNINHLYSSVTLPSTRNVPDARWDTILANYSGRGVQARMVAKRCSCCRFRTAAVSESNANSWPIRWVPSRFVPTTNTCRHSYIINHL